MSAIRLHKIPPHLAPQKGPARLFENPLLERFSRISPRTVLAVYLPVIGFSAWASFSVGVGPAVFAVQFLSGLLFWTLFEYLLHRFVFHFLPRGDFQTRLQFLFHGVHHRHPEDKDRLVMPVALSLLIAAVLLACFSAVLGQRAWSFFAGFTTGYLAYDMTHYCIHHVRPPKWAVLRKLWKHHLDHHFKDTNRGFGVSSSLWDRFFGSA